jgi:hypothetical protein
MRVTLRGFSTLENPIVVPWRRPRVPLRNDRPDHLRSHFLVAFRRSSDGPNPADVTRSAIMQARKSNPVFGKIHPSPYVNFPGEYQ